MSEFSPGESVVQRVYVIVPVFLPLVSEGVCYLGSSQNPWVVKDWAVEQIVMRGWWFLMKTGFEQSPRTEEAV